MAHLFLCAGTGISLLLVNSVLPTLFEDPIGKRLVFGVGGRNVAVAMLYKKKRATGRMKSDYTRTANTRKYTYGQTTHVL